MSLKVTFTARYANQKDDEQELSGELVRSEKSIRPSIINVNNSGYRKDGGTVLLVGDEKFPHRVRVSKTSLPFESAALVLEQAEKDGATLVVKDGVLEVKLPGPETPGAE